MKGLTPTIFQVYEPYHVVCSSFVGQTKIQMKAIASTEIQEIIEQRFMEDPNVVLMECDQREQGVKQQDKVSRSQIK